ncbi:distal tail protein Dit, partial [Bacillus cereus]|uniref:distal tail protein Dit n=1 Tax=Bacillus cereus TaxID=1396 RepID=UPI0015CF39E8
TELIFDDELDRTYLALIDGSIDLEELVNRGKGVITFVCPMPYKLGPTKTVEFQANERGLAANVQNEGSVE